MLSLKIFFLIFFCQISNSQYYYANKPVYNNILLPYRFNQIVFVVSINCTEEKFTNLLNAFILLEKSASENTSALKWQTSVSFGGMSFQMFNATYNVDNLLPCIDCYENSQFEGIEEIDSRTASYIENLECEDLCFEITTKRYTLVISDMCVLGIDKDSFGLLLNNEDDVTKCKNEMSDTWDFFSTTNIMSKDFDRYVNLYDKFGTNPSLAKVNFIAVIKNKNIGILYEIIKCKIFNSNGLCRREKYRDFIGIFKIINDDNSEKTLMTVSLPLNFNDENLFEWFMNNLKSLMNNGTAENYHEYDCAIMNEFLKNINNMKAISEQFNVLIIEDSFSNCLDFNLQWRNYTMRRLEIILLHSNTIINKEAYINIIYEKQRIPMISYNTVTLNHLWLFNISDNTSISNFCEYNTICESKVPQWIINDFPQLNVDDPTTTMTEQNNESIKTTMNDMAATKSITEISSVDDDDDKIIVTSMTTTTNESFNDVNIIIIIGGVIMVILIAGILVFVIKKLIAAKQQKKFRNEIQSRIKNCTFNSKISKEKHCKLFVESKKIVINFEDIRGKGAYATVFTGSLIVNNSFNLLNKTVISKSVSTDLLAIKIQSKFEVNEAEEFLAELNSLIALKTHNNIVKILGWSILQETPILITELADTNLLSYVQAFPNHQNVLKPSLRFLWQISDALNFVADKKMIHRDVACRNILIYNSNCAKLADFGLCCYCDKNGSFKDSMNNKKFPVKWLSIEVLNDGIFSEKSDIWAFGILSYEVFSYGNVPYSEMEYLEMIEYLKEGKRLEKPKDAPTGIYELMIDCWNKDPKKRPNFKEINRRIRLMLEQETVKYGYLILS